MRDAVSVGEDFCLLVSVRFCEVSVANLHIRSCFCFLIVSSMPPLAEARDRILRGEETCRLHRAMSEIEGEAEDICSH